MGIGNSTGLFALSLPYSVSANSEQPPTEKFSEPFFLSSITRYILLSSILSRRKTPMRISCTTSNWTFVTRRNPHRFEECHAALCHRAVLPSAHRRSKLTIGNVREPSWLHRVCPWSFYCSLLRGLTNPHRLTPDPEVGRETFIFMFVVCVAGLEFAAKSERRGSHAPGRSVAQLYAR
jgi:hypothetical protein